MWDHLFSSYFTLQSLRRRFVLERRTRAVDEAAAGTCDAEAEEEAVASGEGDENGATLAEEETRGKLEAGRGSSTLSSPVFSSSFSSTPPVARFLISVASRRERTLEGRRHLIVCVSAVP